MELTPKLAESNARILAGLRAGHYDFLDLGTNQGGGFKIGERLLVIAADEHLCKLHTLLGVDA